MKSKDPKTQGQNTGLNARHGAITKHRVKTNHGGTDKQNLWDIAQAGSNRHTTILCS